MVVTALAVEDLEPGRGGDVLAAIDGVFHVRLEGEHLGRDEGADVEPNAVIQVRAPAERLILQRLPADEDVARRFTLQNVGEPGLQNACGLGARIGAEPRDDGSYQIPVQVPPGRVHCLDEPELGPA